MVKNGRIKYLDALRLLGFIIVFSFHVIVDMHYNKMHDFSFFLNNIYSKPNFNIGMVGMIFFFFTSGASLFLSALKEKKFNIIDFYKKRFLKLIIPFYIIYILYFIIKVILHHTIYVFHYTGSISIYSFIFTIFGIDEYLNACGVSTFSLGIGEWYLGCILLCYLCFPIILYFYKKKPLLVFFIFTLYFVLIQQFIIKCHIVPHQNFFNHIYNFFLGMFLADKRFFNINFKYNKIILFVTLALILIMYFLPFRIFPYDNINMTLSSIFVFFFFYSINGIFSNNKILSNILTIYSKYGLELFLVHHFVIYEVNFILKYQSVNKKAIFIYFIDLFITCVFSAFIHHFCGKIQLIKHNI